MRSTSNLLFVGLLVALFAAAQAEKHTNVDYLSFGYDIYRGNPHSKGVDPGFRIQSIFNLSYNQNITSSDGNWNVPDSVTMARTDACDLNFESTQLDTMASYQQSLESEVSVSGGLAGIASFKASTAYKSVENTMTTTSDKHIFSSAVCDVYTAKIDAYDPPKLHEKFIKALTTLPTDYDEEEYFRLIDNYGTHAVTEINMGARFGMMSTISKTNYESLNSQGISVSVAASFSILGISGGVDHSKNDQKGWGDKYLKATTSYHLISVGAKPIGMDSIAWANQAITQPLPLRYTLIPLSEIIVPRYVRDSLETSRMKAIKANLQTALKNYCSNSLVPQGLVRNCSKPIDVKPAPPKPQPPKINSCRWCTNACGGDYSVDGGHTSGGNNEPNWAYSFGQFCRDPMTKNPHGFTNGIHLCCPKTDATRIGQCKICSSCGKEFSQLVGAIHVNEGRNEFTSAFDDECQGVSRPDRKRPSDGFKICCKQDPICTLCSSCGGTWPQELGVLAANSNSDGWFRGRGEKCEGAVAAPGKNKATGGMKWCCKTHETNRQLNFLDLEEDLTKSI